MQWGRQEGHDPVSGHLVHCPLVVMGLVDEDLVDLSIMAYMVSGPSFSEEGGKALHVAEEHHRDLSLLPLNPVPLGEDLLGDARRKVFLNLCNLLVEGGEVLAGGFGVKRKIVAAFAAELASRLIDRLACWADG